MQVPFYSRLCWIDTRITTSLPLGTSLRVTILLTLLSWTGHALLAQQIGSSDEGFQAGLVGGWFGSSNYQRLQGLDQLNTLHQDWSQHPETAALRGKAWSARWEGYITAPETGQVTFHVMSDHLVALTINDKRIFASKGFLFNSDSIERAGRVVLEKGRRYPIKVQYAHRKGKSFLRVLWSWLGQDRSPIPAKYLTHSQVQADKWSRRLSNPPSSADSISNLSLPQPLTDWSSWPYGYSILLNEKAMFPVDMSFWKMKIDESRQLFVDNHLLAGIDNLHREFHPVEKHPANPVFDDYTHGGYIWPDPQGGYRLYYNQYRLIENDIIVQSVRLALSDDGVHWRKPDLDLPLERSDERQQGTLRIFTFSKKHLGKHNNVLIPYAMLHGVYHEPDNPNPNERWKAVVRDYRVGYTRWEVPFLETHDLTFKSGKLEAAIRDDKTENNVQVFAINKLYTSPDGIRWTAKEEILPQLKTGRFILDLPSGGHFPLAIGAALRTRWDPSLQKYIAHTKHVIGPDWRFDPVFKGRAQGMMESDDLIHWSSPRIFVYPDAEDAKIPGMYGTYESDGFCYESMWLGCLSMIAYLPQEEGGRPEKEHWIRLAGSRDGRHWYYLGDREPLIPAGEDGEWDTHYMRMANLATTGGPIAMGDELWFYYWGRDQGQSFPEHRLHLGIGKLRKDGFASLNADEEEGAVATRPLTFAGEGRLSINLDAKAGGYVKAAVFDEHGDEFDGFTLNDCQAVEGDHTRAALVWKGHKTLASLKDRHIRIVFYLKNAKLYSFWIE